MDHQIEESQTGNIKHSRLFPILVHEENKREIAETNSVRQSSRQKHQKISQDDCHYKYHQYKNVRNNKIKRIIRKEVEQVQSTSGLKEKLKLKKSLQENFSRISSFNGRKEARFNIKVSLQRKLTSMMSYIKIF